MSRHWKPPLLDGTRPPGWRRPRRAVHRRCRVSIGEIRLTVLAGLLLGLVAFEAERRAVFGPSSLASFEEEFGDAETAAGPARIIDGDTFDYAGQRVRIADIDTPEVDGDCAHERDLAAQATDRMAELLDEGPFELHPLGDGRDEDRYGRKLRIVTRDGESLGDVLVAEGLARTWTGRREPWC